MEGEPVPVKRRPGRPAKPKVEAPTIAVTDTPEFKAAVAEEARKAMAGFMAKLEHARQTHGTEAAAGKDDGDRGFIGALALELAELSGQGTGRRYVAPEILRQRTTAREKMVQLILEARAQGKTPTYQLRNKVHLADRIVEPMWIASDHTSKPTEIDWKGVPNEAMIPVNDAAKAIHAEFMRSIGSVEKVVPDDTLGMTHSGLVVRNNAVTTTASRRAAAPQVNGDNAETNEDTGLTVHHQNQPGRYVDKNILGSIMQPARQTA